MSSLVVVAPLSVEARAVRSGAPWAEVQRVGMGPRRAARSSHFVAGADASAVLIAGFCGALDPELEPGDVVLATEVRGPTGTTACADPAILAGVLRRGGLNVRVGPIASSQRLVIRERRRALQRSGALAVDMESAWLAESAGGRPLAVMRVVVDGAGRRLTDPRIAIDGVRALRSLRRCSSVLAEWSKS